MKLCTKFFVLVVVSINDSQIFMYHTICMVRHSAVKFRPNLPVSHDFYNPVQEKNCRNSLFVEILNYTTLLSEKLSNREETLTRR